MKNLMNSLLVFAGVILFADVAVAQTGLVDVPVNTEKVVVTVPGLQGLPPALGTPTDYRMVVRIAPLRPGVKYEATITYDAAVNMGGYSQVWVDGNPFQADWASLVGISTGSGQVEMRGKQEKIIFSIDPSSTSDALYVTLSTNVAFAFRVGVTDRLSGVTVNSQDRWGHYYVKDFDASRTSPFLLKRGPAAIVARPATPRPSLATLRQLLKKRGKTTVVPPVVPTVVAPVVAQPSTQASWVDVPVNTERAVITAQGLQGLPPALGTPTDYRVVLRIAPLRPGVKYEATMTYDAAVNMGGYSQAWVDGNPFQPDWASFVGIGTGTLQTEMRGKQEKIIFSIDAQSTSDALYVTFSTNFAFSFRFGVTDRLSGVTVNSQDRWGHYYVKDFDVSRTSPFLLKRGLTAVVARPAAQGPWVDVPVNAEKAVITAQGLQGLPPSLGTPADYRVVLRIAPLRPGVKYEATMTYDAAVNMGGYSQSWVDGNPFQPDWASFVGIGTGTLQTEMRGKQEKIIFSTDPQSTSDALYVTFSTNFAFSFRFGVTDRLSGVTVNSQDRWGHYYVKDFDASRTSPFLLRR